MIVANKDECDVALQAECWLAGAHSPRLMLLAIVMGDTRWLTHGRRALHHSSPTRHLGQCSAQ